MPKNQTRKNEFAEQEEKILEFWKKNKIFEKSLLRPGGFKGQASKKPIKDYVFYDGPPFITGLPHYATLLPSIAKDMVPRYWTMKGYRVKRVWGWDCHGLPAENKVEEELGLKNKKDIEKLGVGKFVNACRNYVKEGSKQWQWYINRIGRWVDMENAYKTMDLKFMESVIWAFKELYDKGLIYEGYRSSLHCPRCATPLSKFEITMDTGSYKDITETSVVIKFKLKNKNNKYILAWTTTAWTLPGNLALAVGKEIEYIEVKIASDKSNIYILAKERAKEILGDREYEVVKKFKGKDLVGIEYEPVFDHCLDINNQLLNACGDTKQVCALVVLDKSNRVLLGYRKYSVDKILNKDFWIAPGGRSEKGEKFKETIKRELKEECNITDYKIKKYLGMRDGYVEKDIIHLFLLEVDNIEQIKNNEPEKFSEWKFFNKNNIPNELPKEGADKEFFNSAIKWNNAYKIYSADFVSTEEGTGVVHIAPNFGEDDFNLGKKENLPLEDIMDENGCYTEKSGEWKDLYFKKAGKIVMEKLGDKLFSSFNHTHSYPFCYRCNTSLIYKTQKAWYLKIDTIRKKMLETNKKINWIPEYFKKGRFQYNLENAPDWCLSRSRYWGSPIPVWKCKKCDEIKVAGSIKEIEKLSGEKVVDLHRPNIDGFEFKCGKCGSIMKRTKEVLDCWFESASMPFAQYHYPFERKNEWKNIFPADFIIEYTGQLRGWFYYLHVLSNALFDSLVFKNVIVSGVLAGTDGRKMSKSYGNYPDPKNTLDKYGSDALRMYFMTSSIMSGDDLSLNEKDIQDALRKNIMLLWNVAKFFDMFCNDKEKINEAADSINILDKWILLRLNQLIKEVTDNMEKYNLPYATRPITGFIDDLSTWYLRRSRDRFKGDNEDDKTQALITTKYVLIQLSKIIAPVMPFIAEQVWQKVTGNEFKDKNKSVHLEVWPTKSKVKSPQRTSLRGRQKSKVIEDMEMIRKIVEMGLAKRAEVGIKIRQPLNQFSIFNFQFSNKSYEHLINAELNVKKIITKKGKDEIYVELDTKITPELKQEGIKREIVRAINSMRKNNGLTIQDKINVYWDSKNKEIQKIFKKYKNDILKDTLTVNISDNLKSDADCREIKIDNEILLIKIEKI